MNIVKFLELFPILWGNSGMMLFHKGLLIVYGKRNEGEKSVCLSKGLNKRDRFKDGHLLRFIRDPHYFNYFSTLRQGLFYSSGVEYPECGDCVS